IAKEPDVLGAEPSTQRVHEGELAFAAGAVLQALLALGSGEGGELLVELLRRGLRGRGCYGGAAEQQGRADSDADQSIHTNLGSFDLLPLMRVCDGATNSVCSL